MAEICVNAAFELSIHIGQRVRHQDYKGQRVTGVVRALSVEDRAVMADIVLDAPIVIEPLNDGDVPINIHRQHVPAHELAAFDERDELIAQMLAALEAMLDTDPSGTPSMEAGAMARAAIARATGVAS